MKAHIGVDADSGLVHTVIGTAVHVSDVTQAGALLHGKETDSSGGISIRIPLGLMGATIFMLIQGILFSRLILLG